MSRWIFALGFLMAVSLGAGQCGAAAEPTATPLPPTDTLLPTPTATSTPTPTNTPEPTATPIPTPTSTPTPEPTPTPTSTPVVEALGFDRIEFILIEPPPGTNLPSDGTTTFRIVLRYEVASVEDAYVFVALFETGMGTGAIADQKLVKNGVGQVEFQLSVFRPKQPMELQVQLQEARTGGAPAGPPLYVQNVAVYEVQGP